MGHRPPWQVWVVLAISLGMAIALYPIDHIYRAPLWFQPVYLALCVALLYGCYAGHRWVFVVNLLSAWIFPFETWKGIKAPITGSVLTVAQLTCLILLFLAWRYFWTKPKAQPGNTASEPA